MNKTEEKKEAPVLAVACVVSLMELEVIRAIDAREKEIMSLVEMLGESKMAWWRLIMKSYNLDPGYSYILNREDRTVVRCGVRSKPEVR